MCQYLKRVRERQTEKKEKWEAGTQAERLVRGEEGNKDTERRTNSLLC